MSKPSLLVQNIEQRVPDAKLRLSAEQQISKLLNKSQLLVGFVMFTVIFVVGVFFWVLGADSANNIFYLAMVPILLLVARASTALKDGFYRRQLKKLGHSISALEQDPPFVVMTVDGRGYLELKEGILRIIQTKGSTKQMNLKDVINIECIDRKNYTSIFAVFSLNEVICFDLLDDVNEATQRNVSTNSSVAKAEADRINTILKNELIRRLNDYSQIEVHYNSINKTRSEISAGISTLIIVIFSIIAIVIAVTIYYSIEANN